MVRSSKVDLWILKEGECMYLLVIGRGSGDRFRWEFERRIDGNFG